MSQIHIYTLTPAPLPHIYFGETYRVDFGCPLHKFSSNFIIEIYIHCWYECKLVRRLWKIFVSILKS